MAEGTVRVWHDELGWGVLDSPETPGGCWAHFSQLLMPGFHTVTPGQAVSFTFEEADQDGFSFRAVSVRPDGVDPSFVPDPPTPGTAYRSSLTITFGDDAEPPPS